MTIREAIHVLELERPITHDEVKRAFRGMAKKYHPDRQADQDSRSVASEKFIQARKASHVLLDHSEAIINDPSSHRRPEPVVRRAPRQPATVPAFVNHPLVKELDNVVNLFRMIIGGAERKLKIRMISPATVLGNMYEFLFEKHFSGESKLGPAAFALYRFFRLLTGAVFLIGGFLTMSVIGMLLAVVIFPGTIVFLGVYHLYQQLLQTQAGRLNRALNKQHKPEWLRLRKAYLRVRTFPLGAMILMGFAAIRLGSLGSLYIQSVSVVFCLPILLLIMSVSYEWIYFYRVSSRATN